MRKVLAVFMTVMMLISTFTGVISVSAADDTTVTLTEIALGDVAMSDSINGTGAAVATNYINGSYTFAATSNSSWTAVGDDIKAIYKQPTYSYTSVATSTLTSYPNIASGHSAKLMKHTQTANISMFRLKNLVNTANLPSTGKIKITMDVYPTDVTTGTLESTTTTGVKAEKGTLADTYKVRVGDSKGSADTGTVTGTAVKADQWNTITHTVDLASRKTMAGIRYDVNVSATDIKAYNTAFPATIFYDKIKIEYIGTEITDSGFTGGGSSGGGSAPETPDVGGDDNTDNDTTEGEVVTVWEPVINIPFENNSVAPAGTMNIWGKDSSNTNINTLNKFDTYANAGISKPNSTEDFGSALIKSDATGSKNTKGLYEGRLNDFAGFTFESGAKYKYSIWAYLAKTVEDGASDTASMTIKPYSGTATAALGSKKVTLTKGQWQKIEYEVEISGEYAASAGKTSGFRFAFGATSGTNYPTVIYVDNAKVEKLTEKVIVTTKRTKAKIGFEDNTAAPANGINFWGAKPGGGNADGLQKYVNWADETGISKPNSSEDFGAKLMKVDARDTSVSTKGVVTGRINNIPAATVDIKAGKKYVYSVWVLAAKTTTGTAKANMYPYATGSNNLPQNAFNVTADLVEGVWQKISGSFVATDAHVGKDTGFRMNFSAIDSTNYPTLLYADNFTIVEDDDISVSYDITVSASGNGKVTGSGTYKSDEKATLTATPDAGYIFAGWYNGNTLISKSNPYEYTVDGTVTSITGKFEKYVPNIGDNWKTLDAIDFEANGDAVNGTTTTGKTANGRDYALYALDGGNSAIKVASAIKTEAEAGIGTSSNLVYEFEKTEGANIPQGMIRLNNYFDLSDVSVGDILRIRFKVYPTGVTLPDGVTNDSTVVMRGHYSVSGKYGSSASVKNADAIGNRFLKPNQWTEVGLTTTVTQEMIDAGATGLRLEHVNADAALAKTLYFDDFVAEVYQNNPAADKLYVVQNFDYEQALADITLASAAQNAPYTGMRFTRIDNGATYPRFNLFGTGTTGSKIATVANAKDHSGIIAHSGTNAVKVSGRWSANGGVKVEDIFMGRFDKDDIGKKITVSAWVYADKSAGAYKMTFDEATGDYKENSSKTAAVAYTAEELANLEKTMVAISFAGPNDAHYQYRTGTVSSKKHEINWNEWTKISTTITITEAYLDNGVAPGGSLKNTLVSAIRIDQAGANGLEDQAVIDTFYIDDITVEEKLFEISSAIGDHMVYQKGRPIRVWGKNADIGETVTVKFNGVTKTSVTDENGEWIAEFDKIDEYTRGLSIEVNCPGEDDVTFTDVSIGEVILASGQSNMEWNLFKVYEAEDILADVETNDNISILSFENIQASRGSYSIPSSPNGAYWSKKDLETAKICSGVGYITAYNIAKKYNIPVAVVDANLSGSAIKAWLSAETIAARKDDVYKAIYDEMINKTSSVTSGSIWKQVPAGMYNALLAPLDNYEIGIMLWYQGCSDSGKPDLYNYYQYDLINSWRQHFGAEDTPFVICQLAPYLGSYMELRQVQLDTAKRMDNVYLAITADLGPTGSEDKDSKLYSEMTSGNEIHPVRKVPVADRISKILYANYFGEDIVYSGPEYTKMESKEDHAILHFKHIGSGIVKIDENKGITGFEISADGSTFVAATAEVLADNTIKVYAEGIANPVAVRYCWVPWVVPEDALTSEGGKKLGNTLGGNLTNETGIPMGPFMATLPAPTIFAATTATAPTGIDISVAVRNIGYAEASPRLIVGLYDGERLVGLKSESIDFKTIDTKTLDFKFYTLTTNITATTTIKAFLWNDMGTMIPLQGVYPIERK